MTTERDKVGWLTVEVYNLLRNYSVEDVLSVISRKARLDYERVSNSDKNRAGNAGPSMGEISYHERLYEKLKYNSFIHD